MSKVLFSLFPSTGSATIRIFPHQFDPFTLFEYSHSMFCLPGFFPVWLSFPAQMSLDQNSRRLLLPTPVKLWSTRHCSFPSSPRNFFCVFFCVFLYSPLTFFSTDYISHFFFCGWLSQWPVGRVLFAYSRPGLVVLHYLFPLTNFLPQLTPPNPFLPVVLYNQSSVTEGVWRLFVVRFTCQTPRQPSPPSLLAAVQGRLTPQLLAHPCA